MNKPTPYKTEPQKPDTKYEVEENGDVKITQTITTVSYWKSREYLSLIRQNEEALQKTKDNYAEEFIAKMKKQEAEILEEINIMTPIMKKAEELTKIEYEKQRHEGIKSNLIKAIEDDEMNVQWWQQIWLRAKSEIKQPIIKELTADQQAKLVKAMAKLKRKGIQ